MGRHSRTPPELRRKSGKKTPKIRENPETRPNKNPETTKDTSARGNSSKNRTRSTREGKTSRQQEQPRKHRQARRPSPTAAQDTKGTQEQHHKTPAPQQHNATPSDADATRAKPTPRPAIRPQPPAAQHTSHQPAQSARRPPCTRKHDRNLQLRDTADTFLALSYSTTNSSSVCFLLLWSFVDTPLLRCPGVVSA